MFAQLAAFRRQQRRITEFPINAQLTLEDVVRDVLEPMMRDWLDKNAMPIVERLVQAELAQVLGRVGAT
jgi:cell pole-organizing protein PopZ